MEAGETIHPAHDGLLADSDKSFRVWVESRSSSPLECTDLGQWAVSYWWILAFYLDLELPPRHLSRPCSLGSSGQQFPSLHLRCRLCAHCSANIRSYRARLGEYSVGLLGFGFLPVPFLFYLFGDRIRGSSKHAKKDFQIAGWFRGNRFAFTPWPSEVQMLSRFRLGD